MFGTILYISMKSKFLQPDIYTLIWFLESITLPNLCPAKFKLGYLKKGIMGLDAMELGFWDQDFFKNSDVEVVRLWVNPTLPLGY